MSTMMDNVEKFEDRSLDELERVEDPFLRFTHDMSERMARYVPERPSFMYDLPLMADVVEGQLRFRQRFVDQQLRFARKMMKAMKPVMVKIDYLPPKPVRKPAQPAKTTKTTKPTKAKARKAA